ncbi:hypothetical protein SD71_08015 [Cohnella kolymensis]|uniref:Rod shape-determining protein MreD n=1 Tax=Cohnella kolymensis TaxID=1590652 RepID=A0ABR5A5V5_9BACL|nr:rod shape-determining protein MreD [Cohnella kolymensis]KIL36409.1 hypothetical protein SD71_08015 [Cohnella kolymensis]
MRINRVIICTLALLIVESAVVPWLVPSDWSERLLPHLSFIMTMFVAGFSGRHRAFLFGLGFGILSDMQYYGFLIGPYAFGMGLVGYLAGLISERRTFSLGFFMWLLMVAGVVLDTLVYFIYKLFSLTDLALGFVMYWQIAPTVLIQLLIALILYVPIRRWLVHPSLSSADESSD